MSGTLIGYYDLSDSITDTVIEDYRIWGIVRKKLEW